VTKPPANAGLTLRPRRYRKSLHAWAFQSIKERLADGRQGKVTKGGHIGGTAPFGYRVEGTGKAAVLVPVPAEQEALKTIRKARSEGLRAYPNRPSSA
jgi:hypothetical protein